MSEEQKQLIREKFRKLNHLGSLQVIEDFLINELDLATKETERVTEERIVKMILDKIKNTTGINTNGISDNVTMVKVFDDGGLRDFVDEKEYINKADLVRFITLSFTPIIRNK